MTISLKTPAELLLQLAQQAKQRRLDLNLSQEGLAKRAGVSLGSLKRFERSGQISLTSFLKLVLVLDNFSTLETLFTLNKENPFLSLDEILKSPPTRKKGRLK